MSGKRDSDPRPQPWQGCALPTELFPQFFLLLRSVPLNASAKVLHFFEPTKFFNVFFYKKCTFFFILEEKRAFLGVFQA